MDSTKTALSTPKLLELLRDRLPGLGESNESQLTTFARALDELHERLSGLCSDLKADFHVCPQVSQKLVSPTSEKEFCTLLESNTEQREKISGKLGKLTSNLIAVEEVIDDLGDFVRDRAPLESISIIEQKRASKNVFDKCKELESELTEWKKSARRSLEKIGKSSLPEALGLEEAFKSFGPSIGRGRKKKGKRDTTGEATSRADSRPTKDRDRSSSGSDDAESSDVDVERDPNSRSKSKEARSKEIDLARAGLENLVKHHPFARQDLVRAVRFASTTEHSVKKLKVTTLWADRKVNEISVPYEGGPLDENKGATVWDALPVKPPRENMATKEKAVRVPGSDRVVEGDKGKVLVYDECETRYFVGSYEAESKRFELPHPVVETGASREVFANTISYLEGEKRAAEDEDKCLEFVSLHLGLETRMEVEAFLKSFRSRRSEIGREGRPVRVRLEISAIPMWEIDCQPKDLSRERGTWQFKVWVYGLDGKFLALDYPRSFSARASGWCAVAVAAGVPIGYFLMSVLAGI